MKKMKLFYLVAVLAALAISAVMLSGILHTDPMPKVFEYVCKGRYFKVALPSDWRIINDGLLDEKTKVYGVEAFCQKPEYLTPKISVEYYAPGNKTYKTMEEFITRLTFDDGGALDKFTEKHIIDYFRKSNIDLPPFPEGKPEYGPVRDEMVAGRPAKAFERKVYNYMPVLTGYPEKIAVFERYVVIPAQKGFYVLNYSAPLYKAEKYKPVFEKVISSFEPLIK
jgi:hypothetical protein